MSYRQPAAALSLTNATEYGTVYSTEALGALIAPVLFFLLFGVFEPRFSAHHQQSGGIEVASLGATLDRSFEAFVTAAGDNRADAEAA